MSQQIRRKSRGELELLEIKSSILSIKFSYSYRQELARHGIKDLLTPMMDDINLILPKLKGNNIEEHFDIIAKEQVGPYQELVVGLIKSNIPKKPEVGDVCFVILISILKYCFYCRNGHSRQAGHATIPSKVLNQSNIRMSEL